MAPSAKTSLTTIGRDIERPRIPTYLLQSLAVAAGLSLVFYVVIYLFLAETYMGVMFTRRGPIPFMTTYLTFLGLALLGGSMLNLRRESRNFKVIADTLADVKSIEMASARDAIDRLNERITASERAGLVFNRVRRLLHRVENRGSTGDVAALLSEQAEIDRAILSNSYATVRFIGWLIPVLGFIGTVGGISFAIARFPDLFEGGTASLQDNLGPITGNLGVAFETTLLALIKIAVILFVLFAVQKRGNELMNTFDEFCLENLVGKVRGGGIPEDDTPFGELARVLSTHVERMEEKFEQAAERVVSHLVENERERWQSFTDSFKALAKDHQDAVQSSCQVVSSESRKLTDELKNWEPRFRDAVVDMIAEIRGVEEERIRALTGALERTGANVGEALGQEAKRVLEATEKTGTDVREAMGKIEALMHSSEELRTIQQTLATNLAALTEAGDLRKAMDRLNACIEELSPVLAELQKRRRMQVRIVDELEEQ